MSEEIKTIYKISQIFGKAFNQINQLCAHYLADKSLNKSAENNKKQQKKKEVTHQAHSNQKADSKKNYSELVSKVQSKKQKPQTQKKATSQSKASKVINPDKPKQPLSPFFLFQGDQKQNFKKAHPQFSLTQLSVVMGQIWNSLDQQEKQPYIKKHEQLRQVYDRKLKKYFQTHPEQKSKNQLKKQKQQMKKQKMVDESQNKVQAQSSKLSTKDLSKKHVILVQEQEEQSD